LEYSSGRLGTLFSALALQWKYSQNLQVQVITGKDKGKTGIVLEVERKANRLFVEGLNLVSWNCFNLSRIIYRTLVEPKTCERNC
jgi:hypothetical protein